MGRVFAATDPVLGRSVAVKLMRPDQAVKPAARERFLREARAVAALCHDHVVRIYQVGEDAGVPFLAMERLEGESRADRLTAGPLPVGEVVRVGREAAAGLAAAHAAGLVHRDIKPANLWLEAPAGRVKLLDFGLARSLADPGLTASGVVIGTPAYMAPEQAAGRPVDHRADLFSLGCVLYHAATGRWPFDGPDAMAVLHQLATHTPQPADAVNPVVPRWLGGLIGLLLVKDPAGRPASALAVQAGFVTPDGPADRSVAPPAGPRPTFVELLVALKEHDKGTPLSCGKYLLLMYVGWPAVSLGGLAALYQLLAAVGRLPADVAAVPTNNWVAAGVAWSLFSQLLPAVPLAVLVQRRHTARRLRLVCGVADTYPDEVAGCGGAGVLGDPEVVAGLVAARTTGR